MKFKNGVKVDEFYSLIKPQKRLQKNYIRPDFTDIHGLTYDDIKDAPLFSDLWGSDLKNWLDGSLPLVAHNALADAETCGKIVLLAAKKHGSKTLDELLKTCYCLTYVLDRNEQLKMLL